jgi:hypothetical protein
MPTLPTGLHRGTARRAGAGLLGFGVVGIVLLALLAVVLTRAFDALSIVDASAGPLEQATSAVGDAATAFAGFGTSLTAAQRSAASAATTSRNASATATRLADAMGVSFFGAQPFLPLAQDFRQQASDLDAMARDLDALATSLQENHSDVSTIRSDLADLHARLQHAGAPLPLGPLRVLAALLLLWLALPALAAIALGAWLVRASGRGASRREAAARR